jgi:hypothetical protein
LFIALTAQSAVIVFSGRFMYMMVSHINTREDRRWAWINCFVLESLVGILPAVHDWLTGCVAIDRSMTAVQGVYYNKKRSQQFAKFIVGLAYLLVISSSIHEPLNRRLIDNPGSKTHTWCTLLGNRTVMLYESISNILHLLGPFIINLASIFLFLTSLARRKLDLSTRRRSSKTTHRAILVALIFQYRPFILSPVIIVLFSLPRLIFTFAFACIQEDWQRNLYLTGYFISCFPLASTFFVYVLTSPVYTAELRQMIHQ